MKKLAAILVLGCALAAAATAGATTGKVKVVTPHGTLFSNVPFRVLP